VYIGNLPDNCPPDSLRDLFSGYGTIKDLDIIKNFAFVFFDRESDATQAVKDLDNTKLLGQTLTVQISKNQKPKPNSRDRSDDRRDRDRRDDRRQPRRDLNGLINNRGPAHAGMNPLGGILGAAPGGPPLGGLGLLSSLNAVNTLAAAAEQQQRNLELEFRYERERDQLNPDVRGKREDIQARDGPSASKGIPNGFVIYERYFVDPSHPLLKGLPLPELSRPVPELSRVTDGLAAAPRDIYRSNDARRDDYNEFRDRSPLQNSRDYERERDIRELREREYSHLDYHDRRL